MEEKDYKETRKNELNLEAQKLKDRFIDSMLKKFAEFSQDWNALVGKLSSLETSEMKNDKLNKE